MSTVLMTRAQAHPGGGWFTSTAEFLTHSGAETAPWPKAHRAHPLSRVPLRGDASARQESVERHVALSPPSTRSARTGLAPRLPVPALDPPDRAEGRLVMTLGLLAAGALWEVLSSTGALVAGWNDFVALVWRLLA